MVALKSLLEDLPKTQAKTDFRETLVEPLSNWNDWLAISEEEINRGIKLGKGREKVHYFDEMLEIIKLNKLN